MNREEALAEIVRIAKNHELKLNDIKSALNPSIEQQTMESRQTVSTLLSTIGGILIFVGIYFFIAMQWNDINTFSRVLLTLGVGFCLFISAVSCDRVPGYGKAASPLYLMAALLQPVGLGIFFYEYSLMTNPIRCVLLISLMMLIQQGFTFFVTKRTELVVTSIIFGLLFFMAAFDLLFVPYRIAWLVISISLLCITWGINQSRYQAIAAPLFFIASLIFFIISFDILNSKPYELLFLGLSCFMIFLAILAHSRTLMINSTLAAIIYIGYFTAKHFPHTLGWPFTLILMGFILIFFSSMVIKLSRKYLKK